MEKGRAMLLGGTLAIAAASPNRDACVCVRGGCSPSFGKVLNLLLPRGGGGRYVLTCVSFVCRFVSLVMRRSCSESPGAPGHPTWRFVESSSGASLAAPCGHAKVWPFSRILLCEPCEKTPGRLSAFFSSLPRHPLATSMFGAAARVLIWDIRRIAGKVLALMFVGGGPCVFICTQFEK